MGRVDKPEIKDWLILGGLVLAIAIVAFDILESGEVVNVRIVKSAHPLLDEELVRVVKTSPRWKAATQNGQPVRTTCTLPFRFLLR